MASSASILKEHGFKNIKVIRDGARVQIEVTKKDVAESVRKAHRGCAMAVACKRVLVLDGVIMSRATAYLVKGTTALRYKVPPSLAHEVISFDRSGIFEPGIYHLAKPDNRTGRDRTDTRGKRSHQSKGVKEPMRHVTVNVRASLGSERK